MAVQRETAELERTMTQDSATTPGAVWRAVAWVTLLLAVVVAASILAYPKNSGQGGLLAAAGIVIGVGFVFLCGVVGIVCGIFGAHAASDAGDRRFLMILPVYANALLLLGMLALIGQP
jgi:lipopolysaccharide export LptBFGC system permease protein LptF